MRGVEASRCCAAASGICQPGHFASFQMIIGVAGI